MIDPEVKVMEEIYFPSATEMNIPWFKETPDKPMDVIKLAPLSSKQADTTAVELTTNPRKRPVLAVVLATIVHPVYPAENADAEILISIKRF